MKTGKYRHYKGNFYDVLEVATHSETMEKLVVYRPLYGDQALWVRPFDMFNERIEFNGESVQRFEYVVES